MITLITLLIGYLVGVNQAKVLQFLKDWWNKNNPTPTGSI